MNREHLGCPYCLRTDGEHAHDCPELKAMLEIQRLQDENRAKGCHHAYPRYRDGRCMGCGRIP